eukprot:CAMPEP_0174313598 /NCGR_PEP_ID=MMETSP0810-20121108/5087_1 /TAXON_ID=73025 ORGANISM="Eutreptiella gymnastica-like, Strain CCMP1594" /NCGR_SAMPLE_ID=MMETSP0810 /ASSEMBLY_ACC=CAM_ASM_000659 /LENGTH=59 /DNA_ID=CAMNT_0015422425 /DNA_START=1138 /DNA_END=1317 /DNA_ORIENTATION=-
MPRQGTCPAPDTPSVGSNQTTDGVPDRACAALRTTLHQNNGRSQRKYARSTLFAAQTHR